MSLVDIERQGPPALGRGPQCTIGRLMAVLPAPERAALNRMLDNPHWLGTVLARTITDELPGYVAEAGITVLPANLRRHRNRECQCDQSERDRHAAERDA